MNHFLSFAQALLVALCATILTVFVRHFALIPLFNFVSPVMPSLLAVMIAGWFGGLRAGLIATAVNVALLTFVFRAGTGFELAMMPNLIRCTIFVLLGGVISYGIQALHGSLERLSQEVILRKQAETQLQERAERVRLAVEAADIGTWDFNPLTGDQEWSRRTKEMFGLSADADLTGISFRDRVHPEDQERVNQAVQKALDPSGDGTYEIDCRLVWPDGSVHWFIAKGQALFEGENANRRAYRLLGTVFDITERKRTEEIIRASESRLKAIMDNASAVIYLKDLDGRFLMINRRFEELLAVSQEKFVGKSDADLFPSDVVSRIQANDRQVKETCRSMEFEEVVPHKDGLRTYVAVKFPVLDPDGNCIAIGGISTDITDRKKAVDALEAEQEMLRHTIEVQDHQRQLVAYDIHDGLVQFATGALMQLEATRDHEKSGALAEKIENVLGIMRKTVNEGRRIINGIHNTVLDDCGVVAAVEQLIEDEERAHVQIEFKADKQLGRMAPAIELAIYHITQEALTNAYKHSESDKICIEMKRQNSRVLLEVRDWGVGFRPPARSLEIHGLRGMTERARIAGGKCTIQNAPGKGTQVIADLPYRSRN